MPTKEIKHWRKWTIEWSGTAWRNPQGTGASCGGEIEKDSERQADRQTEKERERETGGGTARSDPQGAGTNCGSPACNNVKWSN